MEVTTLSNRLQNEEDTLDRTEERLANALRKVEEVEQIADESERCIPTQAIESGGGVELITSNTGLS